jgi:hypothetical protein
MTAHFSEMKRSIACHICIRNQFDLVVDDQRLLINIAVYKSLATGFYIPEWQSK